MATCGVQRSTYRDGRAPIEEFVPSLRLAVGPVLHLHPRGCIGRVGAARELGDDSLKVLLAHGAEQIHSAAGDVFHVECRPVAGRPVLATINNE